MLINYQHPNLQMNTIKKSKCLLKCMTCGGDNPKKSIDDLFMIEVEEVSIDQICLECYDKILSKKPNPSICMDYIQSYWGLSGGAPDNHFLRHAYKFTNEQYDYMSQLFEKYQEIVLDNDDQELVLVYTLEEFSKKYPNPFY